jgi:phage terminase large subunit-like protein
MIYAPNKSWADLVIDQCRVFPKGKHDDLVDTLSAALRHLRKIGALQRAQEWAADVRSEMNAPQKLAPLYNV